MANIQLPLTYSNELFVAREEEIKIVMDIIGETRSGQAQKRTVTFIGERGIGKSWLLRRLYEVIGQKFKENVMIFTFDLEQYAAETPTSAVADILTRFRREVIGLQGNFGASLAEMNRTVIDELHTRLDSRSLLILADSVYESGWELLGMLEEYFLGPLAIEPRTVIIMAGRGRAYPWRTPELGTRAIFRSLEPFDTDTTLEQLERITVHDKQHVRMELNQQSVERLWNYSKGNPLVNSRLAMDPNPEQALDEAIKDMLSIVEPRDRDDVRRYLEALCVLQSFKEDRIPQMLTAYEPGQDYSAWGYAESRKVRELLTRYAFARWDEDKNGYVISDTPREQVELYLKSKRDKTEWKNLQCAAYALYSQWAQKYQRAQRLWLDEAQYHASQLEGAGFPVEEVCLRHEQPAVQSASGD